MCDFRLLEFLTPEDGADRLSGNVGKEYHYTLRNSPEELSSILWPLRNFK
jgi:hypothetical protein